MGDNTACSLIEDSKGGIWVGFCEYNGGLAYFDGESWTSYNSEQGLASGTVTDLDLSSDGVLWIATVDGVTKYDGETWITYNTEDGLPGLFFSTVAVGPDGSVWAGTDLNGAAHFDGETWTPFSEEDGLISKSCRSSSPATTLTVFSVRV